MSEAEGDTSDSLEYDFVSEHEPNTVYKVKKSKKMTNGKSTVTTITQMVFEDSDTEPHVEILEQPQPRGFRFRYECEGPSHGGLQGEKSEKYRKTYPAIKIKNYSGPARVVVTLVTDETIPRPHAHKLVGKNCNEGTCIVELKSSQNSVTFPNLCVQHVTRRKASEVIEQRILESIKLDKLLKLGDLNAQAELTMEDIKQARAQSEKLAKEMQLNVVRLCFQAYLRDENGQFSRLLPSVLSNPIYDSKSPGANALKICRMDKYGGCCTGNEEVFLLCEKVQKDDIAVRFVEQDEDGNVIWEAFGAFGPFDVHRQYAIVFKTPPYKDPTIDRAVNVLIMLQRKSDTESSDPKSFTYYPQNIDMDDIRKKRKKTLPMYPGNFGSGDEGKQRGGGNNNRYSSMNGASMSSSQGNLPTTVMQDEGTETPTHRVKTAIRRSKHIAQAAPSDLEMDCPTQVTIPTHPPPLPTGPSMQEQQQMELQKQIEYFMSQQQQPMQQQQQQQQQNLMPATIPQTTQMPIPQQQPIFTNSDYHGQIIMAPQPMYMGPHFDQSYITRGAMMKNYSQIPVTVNGLDETDGSVMMESNRGKMKALSTTSQKVSPPIKSVQKSHSDPSGGTAVNVSVQTDADNALKTAERTAKALQMYAASGDIRQLLAVQRYLTCIADDAGDIPLHTCIINHQLEVVHNLLDVMETLPNAHSKINVHNRRLQTPLHLAVITGQAGVVDALLKAGAEPTVLDRHGNTAAHLAVLHKADECLATLLKYVRPRVDKRRPFPELDIKNFDGLTPVHIAAKKENLNAMKLLVKGKADVNMVDGKCGRTALHYAASADDLSTAGWLLLEAKASVNATCFDGNTALHVACGRQNVGMVALLMAAGADPKIENFDYGDDDGFSEDEDDEEKDKDEMTAKNNSKRGQTAEDFAMDNEKILKVLHGHPYTSMSEIHEEADNRAYEQTAEMFTSLTLVTGEQTDSSLSNIGPIKGGGDMCSVSYPQRVKLSQLLDPASPGRDWRALADRLGFSKIISGPESGHSPTRLLFTYYEECGGTVKRLKDALTVIQRLDAVRLISQPDTVKTDSSPGKTVSRDSHVDSGLESDSLAVKTST